MLNEVLFPVTFLIAMLRLEEKGSSHQPAYTEVAEDERGKMEGKRRGALKKQR